MIKQTNVISTKSIHYFENMITSTGNFGANTTDISCYYKSPMMFVTANKPDQARQILKYIASKFMTEDGDFKTNHTCKSIKPEYSEYYTYMNGWIIRAANALHENTIKDNALDFLANYNGKNASSLTNQTKNETDVLSIAHQGLINLEIGNKDAAIDAAKKLMNAIDEQPLLTDGFYLRLNQQGKLIVDFPSEAAPFYYVNRNLQDQLYFMIGYPCAFLAILAKETGSQEFLKAAERYFNFAMSCDESVLQSRFSHKIAWAASILLEVSGKDIYLFPIKKIVDYFGSKQTTNGLWFENEGDETSLDQSAEIACWMISIRKNLQLFLLDEKNVLMNNLNFKNGM